MNFDEARALLISLDGIVSIDDVQAMRDQIGEESSDAQRLRREIAERFRETARRLVNDTSIDDLEFSMIMSHLGFEDVKVLFQLLLSEREDNA